MSALQPRGVEKRPSAEDDSSLPVSKQSLTAPAPRFRSQSVPKPRTVVSGSNNHASKGLRNGGASSKELRLVQPQPESCGRLGIGVAPLAFERSHTLNFEAGLEISDDDAEEIKTSRAVPLHIPKKAQDLLFGSKKSGGNKALDKLGISSKELKLFQGNAKAYGRLGVGVDGSARSSPNTQTRKDEKKNLVSDREDRNNKRREPEPPISFRPDLATILTDENGVRILKRFCLRRHLENGLFFWLSIEEFRRVKSERDVFELANEIWEIYLTDNAELKVHVDRKLLDAVSEKRNAQHFNKYMYNKLQTYVLKHFLMAKVAPRFMGSPEHRELVRIYLFQLGDAARNNAMMHERYGVPFDELVANPVGIQVFRQYLEENSLEPFLDFHLSVKAYTRRLLSSEERRLDAVYIYKRFLDPKSNFCVCESPSVSRRIKQEIKAKEHTTSTFDEVMEVVTSRLISNVYTEFLLSRLYRDVMSYIDATCRVHEHQTLTLESSTKQNDQHLEWFELLKNGAMFTKFGNHRSSHPKFVRCTNNGYLLWVDPQHVEQPKGHEKHFHLSDVRTLYEGKQTSVFNKKRCKAIESKLCLSLVTPQRSLDLVAPDPFTRNQWISALTWLVKLVQKLTKETKARGANDDSKKDISIQDALSRSLARQDIKQNSAAKVTIAQELVEYNVNRIEHNTQPSLSLNNESSTSLNPDEAAPTLTEQPPQAQVKKQTYTPAFMFKKRRSHTSRSLRPSRRSNLLTAAQKLNNSPAPSRGARAVPVGELAEAVLAVDSADEDDVHSVMSEPAKRKKKKVSPKKKGRVKPKAKVGAKGPKSRRSSAITTTSTKPKRKTLPKSTSESGSQTARSTRSTRSARLMKQATKKTPAKRKKKKTLPKSQTSPTPVALKDIQLDESSLSTLDIIAGQKMSPSIQPRKSGLVQSTSVDSLPDRLHATRLSNTEPNLFAVHGNKEESFIGRMKTFFGRTKPSPSPRPTVSKSSMTVTNVMHHDTSSWLMSGYLLKRTETSLITRWHRRFFVLTNESLTYYESEDSDFQAGWIELADVLKVNFQVGKNKGRRFELECAKPQGRIYAIEAETAEDAREWATLLSHCILARDHKSVASTDMEPVVRYMPPSTMTRMERVRSTFTPGYATRSLSNEDQKPLPFLGFPQEQKFGAEPSYSASKTKAVITRTYSGRLLANQDLDDFEKMQLNDVGPMSLRSRFLEFCRKTHVSRNHPTVFRDLVLPLTRSQHHICQFALETLINPHKEEFEVLSSSCNAGKPHGPSFSMSKSQRMSVTSTLCRLQQCRKMKLSGSEYCVYHSFLRMPDVRTYEEANNVLEVPSPVTTKLPRMDMLVFREEFYSWLWTRDCVLGLKSMLSSAPKTVPILLRSLYLVMQMGVVADNNNKQRDQFLRSLGIKEPKKMYIHTCSHTKFFTADFTMRAVKSGARIEGGRRRRVTRTKRSRSPVKQRASSPKPRAGSPGAEKAAKAKAAKAKRAATAKKLRSNKTVKPKRRHTTRLQARSKSYEEEKKVDDEANSDDNSNEDEDDVTIEIRHTRKDATCEACLAVSRAYAHIVKHHVGGTYFTSSTEKALLFMLVTPPDNWYCVENNVVAFSQRIVNVALWPALLGSMKGAATALLVETLEDINALLIRSLPNRASLITLDGWHEYFAPVLQSMPSRNEERTELEQSLFQYTMNVYVMMCSFAFKHTSQFQKCAMDCIHLFQRAAVEKSEAESNIRKLLVAILKEHGTRRGVFPLFNMSHVIWDNLVSLLGVIKTFVFHTPTEDYLTNPDSRSMSESDGITPSHSTEDLRLPKSHTSTPSRSRSRASPQTNSRASLLKLRTIRFGDVVDHGLHWTSDDQVADQAIVDMAIIMLENIVGDSSDSSQSRSASKDKVKLVFFEHSYQFFRDTRTFLQLMQVAKGIFSPQRISSFCEKFVSATDKKARDKVIRTVEKTDNLGRILASQNQTKRSHSEKLRIERGFVTAETVIEHLTIKIEGKSRTLLNLPATCTVASMYQNLKKACEDDPSLARVGTNDYILKFHDTPLVRQRTLRSYGIKTGSTLYLTRRPIKRLVTRTM